MESEKSDGYFTQLLHDTSINDINDDLMMATPTLNQDGNTPSPQTATGGSIKKSQRGDNFAPEEDLLLVNAWLSISLDAIIGSDQKFKTLWGRIHNYYHECKKPNHQERSMHSLMNRWSTIQRSVNKFCGCLAQIENLRPSGHNEEDKIKMAKVTYKESYEKVFKFEHCWDVLRYQPKWILHKEEVWGKKKKGLCDATSETIFLGNEIGSSPQSTHSERPPGKKAQKENEKKRKRSEEKSIQFEKLVSSLREDRKQLHDEKMVKIDMLVQIEERRAKIEERRLEQQENEKIDQIMMMDISRLDAVQQEYFQQRRQEIVENMKTR